MQLSVTFVVGQNACVSASGRCLDRVQPTVVTVAVPGSMICFGFAQQAQPTRNPRVAGAEAPASPSLRASGFERESIPIVFLSFHLPARHVFS